jgi:predicted acyltransferase
MRAQRIASIDQFRGFAILTMVLSNYTVGVKVIPPWLKHASDIGLTVNDLIAPLFIFAIGLTYGLSFRKRVQQDGSLQTYLHFFTRFLAIIGLGAIISSAGTASGRVPDTVEWGVLQAIGMAGLVTLIFIRLSSAWRWGIGFALLAVYQVILDRYWLDYVVSAPHGGLIGSLSWSAMLILSTALADLFFEAERGRKLLPWISLLILLAGIGLAFISPVSKHRVSSSYTLISLGSSALVFFVFDWLSERMHWEGRFFVVWGKNPLILYFLHYIFIGLFFLPGIPFLYADAPLWLVLLEMATLIGGISWVAYWLDRRGIVISL